MKTIFIILLIAIKSTQTLFAQDTLQLSIEDADKVFLEKNLLLIAQGYDIDAQKALEIQAKAYPNPFFKTEVSAFTPERGYGDIGRNGQKAFTFEQLIRLGGKRKIEIEIAKNNTLVKEAQLNEVLRGLRFELHKAFYNIYFNNITINSYTNQLVLLEQTLKAFEQQYDKGNIPLKDLMRLKAVYFQLDFNKTQLIKENSEQIHTLNTLLQNEQIIKPISDLKVQDEYIMNKIPKDSLLAFALKNRGDYKIYQIQNEVSQLNYKLQKKLTIPDLTLGYFYDQASAYTPQYNAITIGIDIPMWNRNKGNILSAEAVSKTQNILLKNKEIEIESEVKNVVRKLLAIENQYQNVDKNFREQFEMLNKGMYDNFLKRNISLIEFTDFFEAYTSSLLNLNKLRASRVEAFEELDYTIGIDISTK